jgi:hypothetical protein
LNFQITRNYSTNIDYNNSIGNKEFANFIPAIFYENADVDRLRILKDNKDKAGIYLWTHLESGKIYIGSALNLSDRLKNYFNKGNLERNKSICNALLHHGYSKFTLTIIEIIDISNLTKAEARKFFLESNII